MMVSISIHFLFLFFSFIRKQSAEMMNFFLTPTAIKYESNIMQTKIPQTVVSDKETFNDRTRKSLVKINLFIKRLKWFQNIFTSNQQTTSKVQKATERQQKWYVDEHMCVRSFCIIDSFFFVGIETRDRDRERETFIFAFQCSCVFVHEKQ
jgi:hypothetical protein